MASQVAVSRNSERETSGNNPFRLIDLARASNFDPTDRELLVAMLEHGNQFAAVVENNRNEIWCSKFTLAAAIMRSSVTVQRRLKRLRLRFGVIKLTRGSNVHVECLKCSSSGKYRGARCENCKGAGVIIRRPCSYQIDPAKLTPRPTPDEQRKQHRSSKKFATRRERTSPKQPSPAAPAGSSGLVPVSAIPAYQANEKERLLRDSRAARHVDGYDGSRKAERVRQLRTELVRVMQAKIRQSKQDVEAYCYAFKVEPSDPRCPKLLTQETALIAACMSLGLSEKEGRELLKFSAESPEGP